MRSFSILSALLSLAASAPAIAQGGTVEYRIRELTGQTAASLADPVLDFTVEARVVGVANRGLGDWAFDIRILGEPETAALGTLARLRISSFGQYFTGAPTTSTTGAGLAGVAAHYRFLVGLNAAFNGVINMNNGDFTNGPDQEIGLVAGTARGTALANTGIIVDDANSIIPATGSDLVIALNNYFGANSNFVELYRFRYTVTDLSERLLDFRLEDAVAATFTDLVQAGSDFSGNTTGGRATIQASNLVVPVGLVPGDSCIRAATNPQFDFTGPGFQFLGSGALATTDGFADVPGGLGGCAPSDPVLAPVSVADVWYRYTPSETDLYSISLCSTTPAWNTVVSVHSACPDAQSSRTIACSDDSDCSGVGLSRITNLPLSAGVSYLIRVARSGSVGTGQAFVLDVVGLPRGACCQPSGTCSVTRQSECAQTWIPGAVCMPNPCPLTISLNPRGPLGVGRGTIAAVGALPVRTCPSDCTLTTLTGATVTLAANPNPDSEFIGWSGPCSGTALCVFNPTQSVEVVANFRCRVEFDSNPGVQVTDLIEFLNTWFLRDPRTDFNGFNGINVGDIFDYLDSWFRGCRN